MQAVPAVALERSNISDAAAAAVRAMIVEGLLVAGERINEVKLAVGLGVSRTPLREALARLAAEGALINRPHFGYFVHPLTLEEFRQIYPMRALLDPEALRLAGLPSTARLASLRKLNRQLSTARSVEQTIARDNSWHLELIADCPNKVLLELIEQFMARTRRYEIALMREKSNVEGTMNKHERILDSLHAGDLERACTLLKQNMQGGSPIIEAWLRSRDAETSPGKNK